MSRLLLLIWAKSDRGGISMDEKHPSGMVANKQCQMGREQVVRAMLGGRTFRQASAGAEMPLKRAMANRLLHAVRTRGEIALQDGRHGHPSKLRGEARAFLEATCREAPCTSSSTVAKTVNYPQQSSAIRTIAGKQPWAVTIAGRLKHANQENNRFFPTESGEHGGSSAATATPSQWPHKSPA